jgi:TonB family protein
MGLLLAASMATKADAQVTAKWEALPSAADMTAAYPRKASEFQIGGGVVISCTATGDGLLKDCAVEGEEPANLGFGEAALVLSAKFRAARQKSDGTPMAGTHVRIPVRFEPPTIPARREVRFPKPPGSYARFGQVGPYYPVRAASRPGAALLECRVTETQRLEACAVVEETPARIGFGDAALKMAQQGWIIAAPKPGGEAEATDEVGRFLVLFEAK